MFDIVIRNGNVLDGSGAEARRLDVGVRGGKIEALGDLSEAEAIEALDAGGKTVCPGFLDLHRHADAALFRPGYGDCDLFQGITTIGNGNCGLSLAPQAGPFREAIGGYLKPVTGDFTGIPVDTFGAYMSALKEQALPVNALMLAGSGTIRASVAGFQKLRLADEDFAAIHQRLEQALADGAGGVSLGLGYAPECYYTRSELIRALRPIQNTDTVLSVHMREEAMKLLSSIDEMITVAKALHVPLQISHLKARLDDKDVALQQLFELTREMAEASGQKERLELLLEAEDVLAERYLHQMDSEVPAEVADQAEEASEDIEDVTSANLGSDLPNEEVPSEDASASSDHIDYLYADLEVPVVAEEVR